MAATDHEVREALNAVDYPASKESLVSHVEHNGGDEEVLRSVRALPLGDYDNIEEVLRSLPLEGGTETPA